MKDSDSLTVNEVVWPWRHENSEKKKGVMPGAFVRVAIVSGAAAVMYFLGHRFASYFIISIACLILTSAILMPSFYDKIDRFGQLAANWAAQFLTWVLLTPFYYLFFWPCSLFFRKNRADNFSTLFPTDKTSYWVERKTIPDFEQYKRQF